jgi:hypothetical protein
MIVAQLIVPVGGQQQHAHPAQPPPEEAQQVDRGLIGPVDILDHHHGQGAGCVDPGQEGREQPVPVRPLAAQRAEFPADLRADVEQRAQRTRGQQPVAGPPQPAGPLRMLLERFDKRGLPDSRLAGHQDQPAVAQPRRAGILGQRVQKRRSLQQLHDLNFPVLARIVPARGPMARHRPPPGPRPAHGSGKPGRQPPFRPRLRRHLRQQHQR